MGATHIKVTSETYPELHRAFLEIEMDNGGHLIGTVYPGTKIDLKCFRVPRKLWGIALEAECALTGLRRDYGEGDWHEFVCGEESAATEIEKRRGDLPQARFILNGFFNGWKGI